MESRSIWVIPQSPQAPLRDTVNARPRQRITLFDFDHKTKTACLVEPAKARSWSVSGDHINYSPHLVAVAKPTVTDARLPWVVDTIDTEAHPAQDNSRVLGSIANTLAREGQVDAGRLGYNQSIRGHHPQVGEPYEEERGGPNVKGDI